MSQRSDIHDVMIPGVSGQSAREWVEGQIKRWKKGGNTNTVLGFCCDFQYDAIKAYCDLMGYGCVKEQHKYNPEDPTHGKMARVTFG